MSENKELKPKSFRIDDEIHEKFKEISNSIGGNQQETFTKLIEAYELQQGKLALREEGANVDQFQKYVACLTRMYVGSLEDKQNITATVRTEFETQLKSKDETILDLQRQLKEAKEQKEEATKKLKASEEKIKELNAYNIDQEKTYNITLNSLQDNLKEKEATLNECKTLNSILTGSHDRLEEQIENMKADIAKAEEQKKELENIKKDYDKLDSDFKAVKDDLSNFKVKHDEIIKDTQKHENEALERAKLEYEKVLLELEKKYQKEIIELKEQKQFEIDKYQSKYYELLEQMEQKKKTTTRRKKEEN